MWFRNLLIYRLTQDIALDYQALEVALASKAARACASNELTTYGFAAPFGKGPDAPLVHASSGCLLIRTAREDRMLPGSVVRDALKDKVDQIEADQLRKVFKKERDQLKDDIVQELLPRAFIRKSSTFAAIDPARGLIFVDAASPKKAEDLLSTLREAIGSLPVRPLSVKIAPTATFTDWMRTEQAAPDFFLLDECELRDTSEDGGMIRAKRQELAAEEMKLHLAAGKLVTELSLAWQDKLSFVLDDKLVIKRLKFESLLQDQASQDGGDDALSQLDASFTLMMLTLREFVPALIDSLGGEELPAEAIANDARQVAVDQEAIDGSEADPLYLDAKKFVRESQRASISAVQRRLKIGYNRAARLIETLEAAGVVSPMHSNGSRTVLAARV